MSHYFEYLATELNEQILLYIMDLSDLKNLYEIKLFNKILEDTNFWLRKLYVDFPKLGLNDIRELYIKNYFDNYGNYGNNLMNIYNYHRFKVAYRNTLMTLRFFTSDKEAVGFNNISTNNLKFLSLIDDKISYYLKYPLMDIEIRRKIKKFVIEYHISIDLYSTTLMLAKSFNLIENNYDNLFKFIFNAYLVSREGV